MLIFQKHILLNEKGIENVIRIGRVPDTGNNVRFSHS